MAWRRTQSCTRRTGNIFTGRFTSARFVMSRARTRGKGRGQSHIVKGNPSHAVESEITSADGCWIEVRGVWVSWIFPLRMTPIWSVGREQKGEIVPKQVCVVDQEQKICPNGVGGRSRRRKSMKIIVFLYFPKKAGKEKEDWPVNFNWTTTAKQQNGRKSNPIIKPSHDKRKEKYWTRALSVSLHSERKTDEAEEPKGKQILITPEASFFF